MPDRPKAADAVIADMTTAFRREANAKHQKVIADRTHYRACALCFANCRLGRPCPCETHLEGG